MTALRDYQQAAVDGTKRYLSEGDGKHPLIMAPTGSGKSRILAELARLAVHGGRRVLVLTHRTELVEQDAMAVSEAVGEWDVGIYAAKIRQRDTRQPVIVASVQSLVRALDRHLPPADVILVDEAHHVPPLDRPSQYARVLERYPDAWRIGLSATPYRMGGGWLHRLTPDSARAFDGLAHRVEMLPLIRAGWLAPLVSYGTEHSIDPSRLTVGSGGDYALGEQADLCSEVADKIIEETLDRMPGRNLAKWFLPTVEATMVFDAALKRHGEAVACIVGDDDWSGRAAALAAAKTGAVRHLVSCATLTTGLDVPTIDAIALVRATRSTGLYVQMCGRGSRTAPDKTDCLVLDYGDNAIRHGPVDEAEPVAFRGREPVGTGGPRGRECASCGRVCSATAPECDGCGTAFPVPQERRHRVSLLPSHAPILGRTGPDGLRWREVTGCTVSLHTTHRGHSLRLDWGTADRQRPIAQFLVLGRRKGRRYAAGKWERTFRCPYPHEYEAAARIARHRWPRVSAIGTRRDAQGYWEVLAVEHREEDGID